MKIRAIVVGLGAMGCQIAKLALAKNIELVGAFDIDKQKVGKDLGELIGLDRKLRIAVHDDLSRIREIDADVAIYATVSRLRDLLPQILPAIESGKDVISTAEELAYPWIHPEAEKIAALAQRFGVAVFGTGVNPGFIPDVIPAILTSGCQEVDSIRIKRVVDLSPYGPTIVKQFGIGLDPEEWRRAKERGEVVGHIGIREAIYYIADCLKLKLDEVRETIEPILARKPRMGSYAKAEPGSVAGTLQRGAGILTGKELIVFEMEGSIQPDAEGIETGVYYAIEGKPSIKVTVKGTETGEQGALVTVARVVNSIPVVLKAPPGLWIQKDLPLGTFSLKI